MNINIEQVLLDILSFVESEKEKQEISNFFANNNNQDFIEQTYLTYLGYSGWIKLSSEKTVYISQPRASAEEVGNAFKLIAERLRNENNEEKKSLRDDFHNKNLYECFEILSKEWHKL